MSAAHVRRGGSRRAKAKKPSKVAVPKKIAKRLPVDQARANKIAGLVFGAFVLAIGLVVLVAIDIPAKAERAAGTAIGHAGFTVSGYQIVGINHMNRALVDAVVTDELQSRAAGGWIGEGAAGAGQRRRNPPPLARLRLGQGCARFAASAGHAGHRHRRAETRRIVAERGAARADRRRGRGSRPRAGRQDARPAVADRPRRKRPGTPARPPDGRRCRRSSPSSLRQPGSAGADGT